MNSLLAERDLPLLNLETYQEIFDFPVIQYYQKLGFDFQRDPFEVIGLEFMNRYLSRLDEAGLASGAYSTLSHFNEKGYRQVILSAMEHQTLEKALATKGIRSFFDEVSGIADHYGGSKLEQGKELIHRLQTVSKTLYLIGDTLHDAEVASQLGVHPILISHGHHSEKRLKKTGAVVVGDFAGIISHFNTYNL